MRGATHQDWCVASRIMCCNPPLCVCVHSCISSSLRRTRFVVCDVANAHKHHRTYPPVTVRVYPYPRSRVGIYVGSDIPYPDPYPPNPYPCTCRSFPIPCWSPAHIGTANHLYYESPEFTKRLVYYPRNRGFIQCSNAEFSLFPMKIDGASFHSKWSLPVIGSGLNSMLLKPMHRLYNLFLDAH